MRPRNTEAQGRRSKESLEGRNNVRIEKLERKLAELRLRVTALEKDALRTSHRVYVRDDI